MHDEVLSSIFSDTCLHTYMHLLHLACTRVSAAIHACPTLNFVRYSYVMYIYVVSKVYIWPGNDLIDSYVCISIDAQTRRLLYLFRFASRCNHIIRFYVLRRGGVQSADSYYHGMNIPRSRRSRLRMHSLKNQ